MSPSRILAAALATCVLATCVLAMSCKEHGHDGQQAHEHGGDGAHGHDDHDKGGAADATEPERPAVSVTVYQDGLELFMEYPALVVGQPSPLVAHFTDARDADGFEVVTKGRVTATLRHADGFEEHFVAERLLRDGIFKPEVRPTKAGEARLVLRLEGEQLSGTVDAGKVRVFSTVAASAAAAPPEEPGEPTVPFLKEQQWKTQYATAIAESRVLQGGVRANGELKPVAGQAAELAAPVMGQIPLVGPVPHLGQVVRKGEVLARLAPVTLAGTTDLATVELEAARARAELGLAEREVARAEEMLAAKAIPEKQLDGARVAREVAAARASAAERQLALYRGTQHGAGGPGGAAFELRSPLDGVVSFADVTPGAVVEPGKRLVAVINPTRLWLEARVYEADAPRVERTPGAAFTVAGFSREFTVDETTGRRVAVGSVVDPGTRTVPVLFELLNPEGRLKPGMFAKVMLFTGETVRAVAIPESAVVDDNGRPTVFVMDGGESFFKRAIRPGVRSGGWVQVLDGVKEGERVVSRGAYELKLSTATGAIPEHGHQH
ncbi:efflux RND transporter periplasmic adaptor subunit [Myxococcus stipitatus]|uniref:efflux RND transporter periplasmic adaptor subunit n=1 Tax=Myxococcus stipitatus TaxID=83455 RepID=UPI001F27F0F5|nr:efflux RND transporter periplasmic adaptor subunit [Myxococcus stipitatus]MCE9671704.1 efflux RND transporter periplasmic adaptor subunit [Myxococcus stipitatus]